MAVLNQEDIKQLRSLFLSAVSSLRHRLASCSVLVSSAFLLKDVALHVLSFLIFLVYSIACYLIALSPTTRYDNIASASTHYSLLIVYDPDSTRIPQLIDIVEIYIYQGDQSQRTLNPKPRRSRQNACRLPRRIYCAPCCRSGLCCGMSFGIDLRLH